MPNVKQIDLYKVYMPPAVVSELSPTLFSGYVAEGPQVKKFENLLSKYFGNPNIILTNSCTSALHLSLMLSVKPHSKYIITTPVTCVATNVSITNTGLTPIWADVDVLTGMLCRDTIEKTYNKLRKHEREQIGAIIFVCWGGNTDNLIEVAEWASEHRIPLIVDAAQAFSATAEGKSTAQIGDMTCLSFQAIKHLTTGDGGALFIKDPQLLNRAANLKWFGISRDSFRTATGEINWKADIPEIGYKFNMNDIAASIGIAQLQDPSLQTRLNSYKLNAQWYYDKFQESVGLDFVPAGNYKGSAAWVYTAVLPAVNVDKLIESLKSLNIISSRMHIRNDIYTGLRGYTPAPLYNTQIFNDKHICIPCGWWVTEEDRDYIYNSVVACIRDLKNK